MLTDQQIARYSRQIILPQVGGRGQQKLLSTRVAVVGGGEMACAAGLYLAAAGIGELSMIGCEQSVCNDLEALNPDCHVAFSTVPTSGDEASKIARRHDIVVDAGGPSATTSFLNAACFALHKPLVWGTVAGALGQAAVLAGYRVAVPCYGCQQIQAARQDLVRSATGRESVLASLAAVSRAVGGFIGTVQSTEVVKLTLGLDRTLVGRLLVYDALNAVVREVNIVKDSRCAVCAEGTRTST